jgi:hypothetical protein
VAVVFRGLGAWFQGHVQALQSWMLRFSVSVTFHAFTRLHQPAGQRALVLQVLANRPDIVREDYMNELCVLQVWVVWGCGRALARAG